MIGFGGPQFFFKSRTIPKSLFFGVSGTGFNTDIDTIFHNQMGVNIKTLCLGLVPRVNGHHFTILYLSILSGFYVALY
jgi:hypothetical protein